MRAFLNLLLLAFLLCSQSTVAKGPSGKIGYSDSDGLTMATAIVITGAKGERDGVHAEYEWLDQHLPGAEVKIQGIESDDVHIFDTLTVILANGETRLVYFDITAFFGK